MIVSFGCAVWMRIRESAWACRLMCRWSLKGNRNDRSSTSNEHRLRFASACAATGALHEGWIQGERMKILHYRLALFAVAIGLVGMLPAMAEVDRSLDGDKKCTVCHDENWRVPVLTIYQTKHGVKGDSRTPGCQSCHGESVQHQEDPSKSPEVVFGAKSKLKSSVEARNAACLTCHESSVRPRPNWSGSLHETRGVACTDCHEAHNPNPKVMNKLTQPETASPAIKTSARRFIAFQDIRSSKAR